MSRYSKTAALALVVLTTCAAGCFSNEGEAGPRTARNEPLDIWFSTVYSAYMPDGSQAFRVPAVVDGTSPDTWQVEPPDAAFLQINRLMHSVMVTPRRAGVFKLTARSGKRTGTVDLVVTEANKDLLALGAARFNNGVDLDMTLVALFTGRLTQTNVACANCHGASSGLFGVQLTPQQIGGYSDGELREIIANGVKPFGAPFTMSTGREDRFSLFHRWSASEDEYRGLALYLRSLEPVSQSPSNGGSNMDTGDERDEDVQSIGCGPTICQPPKGFQGALCCRSHFEGICGQMITGSCNDLPPDPDPQCEGATVKYNTSSVELQSCCAANNECGLVFLDISPGCTSLSAARTIGPVLRGADFARSLPAPRTCDGVPITTSAAGSGG